MRTITEVREYVVGQRARGARIGLVPTMGYFHAGHLELMRRAGGAGYTVVVSIFVNPTQFGPGEDYERYPRDLARDAQMAQTAGADVLFVPEAAEMYPSGYGTYVQVEGVSEGLCGAARPGHFRGVATVVCKLFNIVQPEAAFFGQKDYQQVMVIKRMAADLNLPVAITVVPTVREADGLAMSSRNTYLSPEERRQALALYQALRLGERLIKSGERRAAAVETALREGLQKPGVRLDYAEVRRAGDLARVEVIEDDAVLLVAAWVGQTRLIDNLVVGV